MKKYQLIYHDNNKNLFFQKFIEISKKSECKMQ